MNKPPFDSVLGRIPSGIFILSIRHREQETGMLASWVMQAGFDPPMVTVAVRQGRYVGQWIDEGAPFALNVLSDGQKDMLAHFGRGFEPGAPAFEGLQIDRSQRGVPLLAESLGYLECEATGSIESGDHRIFLAKVIDGVSKADGAPMVHVRKSGSHY